MNKQLDKPQLGNLTNTAQTKNEYAKDLKTLRYTELLELRDRQANLLASK